MFPGKIGRQFTGIGNVVTTYKPEYMTTCRINMTVQH